jgi:hypothetical protein
MNNTDHHCGYESVSFDRTAGAHQHPQINSSQSDKFRANKTNKANKFKQDKRFI